MNYQPLEQRKVHPTNPTEQSTNHSSTENQPTTQGPNKKSSRSSVNNDSQGSNSIPPLMPTENRPGQNKNRPSSTQQSSRVQQQQQNTNRSNSTTQLSVTIPKNSSVAAHKSSSPQSPNLNQK